MVKQAIRNSGTYSQLVVRYVLQIPFGKVASYGQIALYAGSPRAARQVGWILNNSAYAENELPWWRVINNSGRISIKGSVFSAQDQRLRLEGEGIKVNDDFTLDINKYRWHKDYKLLKATSCKNAGGW